MGPAALCASLAVGGGTVGLRIWEWGRLRHHRIEIVYEIAVNRSKLGAD